MSAALVMREAFGDKEWWVSSSEASYKALAIFLLSKGVSIEDAAEVLSSAHAATAAEYGE